MHHRKQSSWWKSFYYSHPYLTIFTILILDNLILIAAAAWLISYLMVKQQWQGYTELTWNLYLNNFEYLTVFTANSGGIYDQAPSSIVAVKIVLSVIQMITFTGSLIGLATSMLQGMFQKRVANMGKIGLKNHYVLLNWSDAGANLVKEFSFLEGRKDIVILADEERQSIQEDIDNVFLGSGARKKKTKIFIKQGDPSSRKALQDVNIDKAAAIAVLLPADWDEKSSANDVIAFKQLMSIIGITKKTPVVVECESEEMVSSLQNLIHASPEIASCPISFFSRSEVVGSVLARTAINASFADLYYYLLSYQGGSFYAVRNPKSIGEALPHYGSALPVASYGDSLYLLASSSSKLFSHPWKTKYRSQVNYENKLRSNDFSLYVVGQNARSEVILKEVETYAKSKEGRVKVKSYPSDVDAETLLSEVSTGKGEKKILILSDESAGKGETDTNVFVTLLRLKASGKLSEDVEISAELLEPTNRYALETLAVRNIIVANQIIALYFVQLLTHPEGDSFYRDLLLTDSLQHPAVSFDIRYAQEILDLKEPMVFHSRGDFVHAVYEASHHEFLPIGFVGDVKEKENMVSKITETAAGVVKGAVDLTSKTLSSVTSALSLDVSPVDEPVDETKIELLSDSLSKKEKIRVEKNTTLVLLHYPSQG